MKTKCVKCSYESENNLEKFGIPLCSVCLRFAPNDEEKFKEYLKEKVNSEELNSFRKFSEIGRPQLKSMTKKASQGSPMSRPPFGYQFIDGKIIPAQNWKEVEEIFENFLNENLSLRKLSEKHNLSVNGLKKILRNFTYIGKIKFNHQVHQGTHQPIISSTLFNHVQNKLDKLERK